MRSTDLKFRGLRALRRGIYLLFRTRSQSLRDTLTSRTCPAAGQFARSAGRLTGLKKNNTPASMPDNRPDSTAARDLQPIERFHIIVGDCLPRLGRHCHEYLIQHRLRAWPGGIHVRIVRPPHQVVYTDEFPRQDGWPVVLNGGMELAQPDLVRALAGVVL